MLQKTITYSWIFISVLLLFSCKIGTKANVEAKTELSVLDSAKTPYSAIQRLISGNHRFANEKSEFQHIHSNHLDSLLKNQSPYACIVSCSDSRVPVEYIFDEGAGDLFVVRTAGNTVSDPSTLGSIEYAAEQLKVRAIVVMGHDACLTVQSAFDFKPKKHLKETKDTKGAEEVETDSSPNWTTLISCINETFRKSRNSISTIHQATLFNVQQQVDLIKANPIIAKKITDGELVVVGAIYSLNTRKVKFWSK